MSPYYPKKKVFSFQKSQYEELQFAVKNWKGKNYADIQVYQIEEDGSKVGTQKGLYLAVDKLPEMKEGIEKLIEAVDAEKV